MNPSLQTAIEALGVAINAMESMEKMREVKYAGEDFKTDFDTLGTHLVLALEALNEFLADS